MSYLFCPNCGHKYTSGELKKFRKKRAMMMCANCGFVLYNNPKPTALALVRDKSGRILLIKRNIKPYRYYWSLPGGFLNYGEDPKIALKREMREELGAKLEVGEIITTYQDYYYNRGKRSERYSLTVLIFSVKLSHNTKLVAADDAKDFQFFSPDNLPSKIAFSGLRKFLNSIKQKK